MHIQLSEDQEANHRWLTFRCCDLEVKECKWQTNGNTEDEVMRRVEEHFHEKHGFAFRSCNPDHRSSKRSASRRHSQGPNRQSASRAGLEAYAGSRSNCASSGPS